MMGNTFNNHKVTSVERLTEREDVYCLSVDKHHNFALSSGVFVHNCEDFQVQGLNHLGSDVYKGNSAGERQRIDVCCSLALQDLIRARVGIDTNLFACDEVAANLDAEGSERMLRLLRDLAKDGLSVYYITHDSRMKDLFTHRLLAIKEGGISRIESVA